MKDTDYAMNIMEIWTTLDELEGTKTRGYFTYRSGIFLFSTGLHVTIACAY